MSFDIHDPLLDVRCSRLLEASAGTGKTYSISHLFIRLLLSDPLIPFDRIALITFTKKATASLKNRLKQNIDEASKQLLNDQILWPYLQRAVSLKPKELILRRLLEAILQFDQIRISTLHSFASSLLQQLGWEISAAGPVGEEDAFLKRLIRLQLQSLDKATLYRWGLPQLVEQAYSSSPEKLVDELAYSLKSGLEIDLDENLSEAHEQILQLLLQPQAQKIALLVEEEGALFTKIYNRTGTLNYPIAKGLEAWIDSVKEKRLVDIEAILTLVDAFQPDKILKKSKVTACHLSDYFLNWAPHVVLLKKLKSKKQVLEKLASHLKKRLSPILQEDERIDQNVALQKLANRLDCKASAKALAQGFDVLIVDEFQDTDPLQWKILSTLRQENPHLSLILVGDPKQSIYAFRQADIYSYMQARHFIEKIGGKLELLDTNYRSHPNLVYALNHLFDSHSLPHWMKLPRTGQSLLCPPIHPGMRASLEQTPNTPARLQFFQLEKGNQSQTAQLQAQLIQSSYFKMCEKGMRTFAALVSTANEASALESELRRFSIPCQLQRPTPFSSLSATHIYKMVLAAWLNPKDEVAMKSLLYLPCWNYSIEELDHYFSTDHEGSYLFWDRVQYLHSLLVYKGVGAFHEAWLNSFLLGKSKRIQDLLEEHPGGRAILDQWRSLVTWMHQHTPQIASKAALDLVVEVLNDFHKETAVYASKIQEGSIQILTIHACKGLEYDVVYSLGTASSSKRPKKTSWYTSFSQGSMKLACHDDIDTHPKYQASCDEQDAEKARRLYVAWTRAKQYLFITLPSTRSGSKLEKGSASCIELLMAAWENPSEIDYEPLYQIIKEGRFERFQAKIQECIEQGWAQYWSLDQGVVGTIDSLARQQAPSKPLALPLIDLSQRLYKRPFRSLQESFSSLSSKIESSQEIEKIEPLSASPTQAYDALGELPKGKEVGIFWHEAIQRALQFSKYEKKVQRIREQLTEWFERKYSSLEDWQRLILENACNLLSRQWSFEGFSFNFLELPQGALRTEKKFILSKACAKELLDEAASYPLSSQGEAMPFQIQGVIDAWVLHEGYCIFFDWKSNWIGTHANDYSSQAMIANALEHRYDLQARIYQKAIAAYLQKRESISFQAGVYVYLRACEAICWNDQQGKFEAFHR